MKPFVRFAAGALAALSLLAAAHRAEAQTVVVGPGASGVAASPGAQFTVPVVADMTSAGGASLGAITARLLWRPAAARFVGISAGTFGTPAVNADSATGTLRFAVANAAGATGTPVLLTAVFQAMGAAGDTATFHVAVDEITAAGSFADLLPITAGTGAMFCAAGGLSGDVDASADISSHDALVVITSAVGLPVAPYSVTNGDVDGDGKVTTRDALGILTYVVGLPTPGFFVGQMATGGCAVHGLGSVAIAPVGLSLAAGDRMPLSAVTKDSVGTIVGAAPAVAWLSRNPAVATVDSLGQVTAVGAGSTWVVAVASAAPVVTDSTAVSVSAVRHVWWVNPAVAAGNQVELGSTLFPFSSIAPAIAAAASGDTVKVAVALYGEPVHVTKSLHLLGIIDAAWPRLRNSLGPAITIDSGLTVTVSAFQIEDSQGGIVASHPQALTLTDVHVLRSTGPGIAVVGGDTLAVSSSSIAGAVDMGIAAESLRVSSFHQVSVDLIASGGGGKRPGAIGAVLSDSVDLLGVTAQTADLQLNGNRANSLRNVTVSGVSGPGLEMSGGMNASIVGLDVSGAQAMGPFPGPSDFWSHAVAIDLGGTVRLDSSVIHDNTQLALMVSNATAVTSRGLQVLRNAGDLQTPTALLYSALTARVAQATFAGNHYGALGVSYGNSVEVDSSSFDETNVAVSNATVFTMLGGVVTDGYDYAIGVYGAGTVTLRGIEVAGTQLGNATCCSSPSSPAIAAVTIQSTDSADVDSLWIHDSQAGSLNIENTRAFQVRGVTAERGWLTDPSPYGGYGPTLRLGYVQTGRVSQSVIDDRGGHATVSLDTYLGHPVSVVVDSVTFLGSVVGVNAINNWGIYYPDTFVVRGSSFQPGGVPIGTAIQSSGWKSLQIIGNTMDSVMGYALYANHAGSTVAQNNVASHTGSGLFFDSENQGDSVVASGNTVVCTGAGGSTGVASYYAPFFATGNTVQGCQTGIFGFDSYYGPYAASVRGNAVTGSALSGNAGIMLFGYFRMPEVVQNDVSGGQFNDGIAVTAYAAPYQIDTLRLDSNTVHDFSGRGVHVGGGVSSARLRGNWVTRFDSVSGSAYGMLLDHTGGARLVDNKLSATGANGMDIEASGDTIFLDSTVIVDDSATALTVAGSNGAVVLLGNYNYLARNGAGMFGNGGQLQMYQSVFQGNTLFGVKGPISWTVNADWWGDTLGPARPGNGSLGDSVIGANADTWLSAPPAGVPTGAPRVFLSARPQLLTSARLTPVVMPGATRAVRAANAGASRAAPAATAEVRARVVQAQRDEARRARDRSAP